MEIDTRTQRHDGKKKIQKHVTLDPEAVARIKLYADRNGANFSATIQMLALNSLDDNELTDTIEYLSHMLDKRMQQQQNRFAKLMSMAAIEAGKTSGVVDALLLLILGNEAREKGDDFNKQIRVGTETPLDRKTRAVAKAIQENSRKRAVQRLKNPLEELTEILHMIQQEEIEKLAAQEDLKR